MNGNARDEAGPRHQHDHEPDAAQAQRPVGMDRRAEHGTADRHRLTDGLRNCAPVCVGSIATLPVLPRTIYNAACPRKSRFHPPRIRDRLTRRESLPRPARPRSAGQGEAGGSIRCSCNRNPRRREGQEAAKAPKLPKPLEPALVREVFTRFREVNPEPKGELEHVNPFTLLVAVVLSAQATDAGVNRATRSLFAIADTPQKMLDLGEDRRPRAVKTIGLFRNKAKNVIALSQQLIDEYGGEVPRDREALEKLPGVGRKTANVVLNMAFGEETMAVDTHVFRVVEPHPARARQDAAGRRAWAAQGHSAGVSPARAPLADPAWPLCVQGAQARLPALPDQRHLPLRAEDRDYAGNPALSLASAQHPETGQARRPDDDPPPCEGGEAVLRHVGQKPLHDEEPGHECRRKARPR